MKKEFIRYNFYAIVVSHSSLSAISANVSVSSSSTCVSVAVAIEI